MICFAALTMGYNGIYGKYFYLSNVNFDEKYIFLSIHKVIKSLILHAYSRSTEFKLCQLKESPSPNHCFKAEMFAWTSSGVDGIKFYSLHE